jgi:uncharacterized protein with ParB-like and HNH nuclease domain
MHFDDIVQRIRSGSWECNYSLNHLPAVIAEWQLPQEGGLQLEPDFQRGHVWTRAQQTAFMEYVLTGGQSGLVLYLNKPDWHGSKRTKYNEFVVVDGLQRISAILGFMKNEVPAFGHFYREFEGSLSLRQTIKINVNSLQTKAEVLQWYLQMNGGGTPHSPEELARVEALLAKETKP